MITLASRLINKKVRFEVSKNWKQVGDNFQQQMPTLLQKHNNSKARKDPKETQKSPKESMLLAKIEDNRRMKTIDKEVSLNNKKHMLHLPCIFQTQNLIQKRKQSKGLFRDEKESQGKSKGTARRQKINKQKQKNKENAGSKTRHEEQENLKGDESKVYHNFINKKKDKKMTYMRKIIEKVVSEDIDPWNLQVSQVKHNYRPHFKFSAQEGRVYEEEEWDREVLGCYNHRLEPF